MKRPRAVTAASHLTAGVFGSARPYICSRCLSNTARKALTSTKAYTPLSTRRLISLRGPDVNHFLQGIVTQNTSPKIPRSALGFYAALLNAQGRVLNDVFIYTHNGPDSKGQNQQGFLIEVDAAEADKLFKHIKRHKLRAKFDLRLVEPGEMQVWQRWDDAESKTWKAHSLASASPSEANAQENGIVLPDTRAPGMGYRLILSDGRRPELDAEAVEEKEYQIRRYTKGVAEGQKEILSGSALPQESNIDYMGGMDYRKGCYVGQELTIRTHHTGVVRKRILPVAIYSSEEAMPTELAYAASGVDGAHIPVETSIKMIAKKGRSAGKYLAGVGNVGLALCRLEMMTDVVLGVEGSAGSYNAGDEFTLDVAPDEGSKLDLKVKAFVPSWHLNR